MNSNSSALKNLYDIVPQLEIPIIRDLFDSGVFGSFVLDEDLCLVKANDSFLNSIDADISDIRMRRFCELDFEGKSGLSICLESIRIAKKAFSNIELCYRLKDKSCAYLSIKFLGLFEGDDFSGIIGFVENITYHKVSERALTMIAEAVSKSNGAKFFDTLTTVIARVLNVKLVVIGKYDHQTKLIHSKSMCCNDELCEKTLIEKDNSFIQKLINEKDLIVFTQDFKKIFPDSNLICKNNLESSVTISLINSKNKFVGFISIMDDKPIKHVNLAVTILQMYGPRAIFEFEKEDNDDSKERLNFEYHELFERSSLGIALFGANAEMIKMNEQFIKLMNTPESEMVGFNYQKNQNNVNIRKGQIILEHCITNKLDHFRVELSFVGPQNKVIWTDNFFSFIYNKKGHLLKLLILSQEITDKKKTQIKLEENNKKLDDSNQELKKYIKSNFELQNFAYVASHDLKEPMRTISNFISLLSVQMEGRLSEVEKEYMHFILDGVGNMNQLIDDLLAYSRVNDRKEEKVKINLPDMLFLIERSLELTIKECNAELIIGELPDVIIGSKTKIKQLFQNLIANALKFRKKDTNPIVKIEAVDLGNKYQFSISDNGIGIKKQFHDKIFSVFKRLHSKTEYKGSGIGLSICKKVVQQHSGDIWIESEEGKGATFLFTLSKDGGVRLY